MRTGRQHLQMEYDVSTDALDDLRFVSQSPTRARLLATLAEAGPTSRTDLRDGVDASRTTVSRNLDVLVERGWVTESDAEYRATPGGELLASALEEFLATAETVDRLEPFFEWLPADCADLSWEWFADADVYPSTPSDPYAPVDRHAERLETATRLRCLLPQVGLRPMRALGRELTGFDHEVVVSPAVGETLRTEPKYVEGVKAVAARGRVRFYVSEEPIPTYVGLFDDDVQIGVSDDDGVPRAMVETSDERVRRWAEDQYEAYLASAEPLRDEQSTPPPSFEE